MTVDLDEPMTMLASGATVFQAIFDRVLGLVAAGHILTVDGEELTIEPAIDADGTEWLRRQSQQVAAILASVRVH